MKEKIEKLKSLGVKIEIIPSDGRGNTGYNYDVLALNHSDTNEEVEKKIDEKIKFFEDRSWIREVKETKIPISSICETCKNYTFNQLFVTDYNRVCTSIKCERKHYQNIYKHSSEPVFFCKDYERHGIPIL